MVRKWRAGGGVCGEREEPFEAQGKQARIGFDIHGKE
jgi:hypothetical protein